MQFWVCFSFYFIKLQIVCYQILFDILVRFVNSNAAWFVGPSIILVLRLMSNENIYKTKVLLS